MKKLRMVILSLSAYSLFVSIFWLLYALVFNNSDYGNSLIDNSLLNNLKIPFATNSLVILFMFGITLGWYIYHKKDRPESVTNAIIFILYLIYLGLYIFGIVDICKNADLSSMCGSQSLIISITSGTGLALASFPTLMHLIASVYTGGFDNTDEPYNIYAFVYTIIGFCYITFFLTVTFIDTWYIFIDVFALNENGLIYTLIILTFILCAGLRFNAVTINIINITLTSGFVISWIIIIIIHNDVLYRFLCTFNLLMCIPLAVLSVFILKRYIQVDRFYKGRTKNFLDE